MTEPSIFCTDDETTSEDLSLFHQDFQGPQKRVLSVFPHLADSGSE